jgi:uncharacterized OB-fold protein
MTEADDLDASYSSRERAFADRLLTDGLVITVCESCGTRTFPLPPRCLDCGADEWSFEPTDGRGRVRGYTHVRRPSDSRFEPPVTSAFVDLDAGPAVLGHVTGDPPDVAVGDRVEFEEAVVVHGRLRLSFSV